MPKPSERLDRARKEESTMPYNTHRPEHELDQILDEHDAKLEELKGLSLRILDIQEKQAKTLDNISKILVARR